MRTGVRTCMYDYYITIIIYAGAMHANVYMRTCVRAHVCTCVRVRMRMCVRDRLHVCARVGARTCVCA